MTRDQAVTLLLARLGNRSAAQYSASILLELDQAQFRLEEDPVLLPWFLLTQSGSTALTIGDDALAVNTDFIMESEETSIQIYDSTELKWVDLKKDDYENLQEEFFDADAGVPTRYALVGLNFRLRPFPDAAYLARVLYFAHDVLPAASNVENKWLKYGSDLLLAETGYMMASLYTQDMELATQFDAQRKVAKDRLWKMNEARMHANRDYMMGSE